MKKLPKPSELPKAITLVLVRPPQTKERELARTFLAQSPLTEFCRALFNLNDFVYAE